MVIDDQKKKSVNHTAKRIVPFRAKNYRQLPTIAEVKRGQQLSSIIQNCRRKKRSTIQRSRSCPLGLRINNNYQQLQKDKVGQRLSTINQNCKRTRKCQPLSTITNNYFRSFSRDYCDSQCEHCEQPN